MANSIFLNALETCGVCASSNLKPCLCIDNVHVAHEFQANSLPSDKSNTYPLHLNHCVECGFHQLKQYIKPERLYENYNFCFSHWKPQPHIEDQISFLSEQAVQSLLEIGANDGSFLLRWKELSGRDGVGIEPNSHACNIARKSGISIINDYFGQESARTSLMNAKPFDCIVARQVLEHVPAPKEFIVECYDLLTDNGLILIEVPDIEPLVTSGDCTFLWEEHINYFTFDSLSKILIDCNFDVIWVQRHPFSGVALTIVARKKASRSEKTESIKSAPRPCKLKDSHKITHRFLNDLINAAEHRNILPVIYGAGCRTNTFLAANNWGRNKIACIIDDQPEKQNLFMPGTHIPIIKLANLPISNDGYLFLLIVNNENNEKVIKKIKAEVEAKVAICPVTGPGDILKEIVTCKANMMEQLNLD